MRSITNMKKFFTTILFVVALMSVSGVITGCSGGDVKLDTNAEKDRTDKLVKLREIYDRAGGNYSSLAGPDKDEFLKLCDGDEKKAQDTWNLMKAGTPGGGNAQPPQ